MVLEQRGIGNPPAAERFSTTIKILYAPVGGTMFVENMGNFKKNTTAFKIEDKINYSNECILVYF